MTIASVHTVVKSRRDAHPFGAGLFRFVPLAVVAPGFVEPSDDDKAAAAAMFARGGDGIPYDLLAAEHAGYDAVTAGCYA